MSAAPSRLVSLREQADVLTRLEEIVTADEKTLASGRIEIVVERERQRAALLARLEEISRALARAPRAGTTEAVCATSRGASRGATSSSADATALARANRDKAQDLERRTKTVLTAWSDRREHALASLESIRSGKQMLASWRSGSGQASDFDVKR